MAIRRVPVEVENNTLYIVAMVSVKTLFTLSTKSLPWLGPGHVAAQTARLGSSWGRCSWGREASLGDEQEMVRSIERHCKKPINHGQDDEQSL